MELLPPRLLGMSFSIKLNLLTMIGASPKLLMIISLMVPILSVCSFGGEGQFNPRTDHCERGIWKY